MQKNTVSLMIYWDHNIITNIFNSFFLGNLILTIVNRLKKIYKLLNNYKLQKIHIRNIENMIHYSINSLETQYNIY